MVGKMNSNGFGNNIKSIPKGWFAFECLELLI